jgi:hypothetical protein
MISGTNIYIHSESPRLLIGRGSGVLVPLILSRIRVDWMIDFIAPYTFTHLGTTGNTALSLLYTLYSSPLYTH